jgi:2-polyprenyl-3-methyl-5-hydroxy-6-metoxy-1,4-benzoquinol methylase
MTSSERAEDQGQDSVESFAWQWTQRTVRDSLRNFHRRLFLDLAITADRFRGKTVAYFGSGNGRHPWAISQLSEPARIVSVELALPSIEYQKAFLKDPVFEIVQGDMSRVDLKADFIYLIGVIQHTADIKATLRNAWNCLNEDGEIGVSFYMWTPATIGMEPIRFVMKRLPHRLAWFFSYFLAPLFMARKAGRESGYMNAVHTAYDWFGSHDYQHYMTRGRIDRLFADCGIDQRCVMRMRTKGLFRLKKYSPAYLARLSDDYHQFGDKAGVIP